VLAVDGGGIRGIIPAMILAELQRRIGNRGPSGLQPEGRTEHPCHFGRTHLARDNQSYALADGGVHVYVSNPSMAAYAEALSLYKHPPCFMVVSVGTGDQDRSSFHG
jgi:patatin-like phospholipase/acyl hydrolase